MSRGLGRVQRAVLVALNDRDNLSAADLASVVYDQEWRGVGVRGWHRAYWFTAAQMSALRRALAALARDGLVRQDRGRRGRDSARWRRSDDRW
jgi:hypothetical protein